MPEITIPHVLGTGAEAIGYGRMGVNIVKALRERGVTVYDSIDDEPFERGTNEPQRAYGKTNVVCWMSVPTHARGWFEGQVPMVLTMWEATRLPESFRETFDEFETILVPSEHNVELFSQYHKNVQYVPLGVDPEVWRFRPRKPPETRFNFLIGGSGPRKGTDLAVKAFRKVFGQEGSWPSDGPVPYLTLKSPKPEDFYGERIERVPGRISPEDELALYAGAHCYLQPSRGEGFGLQPLQAIAQGCPTILTDAHGHAAFAKHGMGIGWDYKPAAYFVYGDAGEWWEPDFDELCETMFWTYHNYDEACLRAEEGSAAVLSEFTWDRTAERFLEGVGDRLTSYEGSGEWHTPCALLYRVVTNCDWKADIGGRIYFLRAGEPQYHPADVKRILFDAGKLDAACLDDDGLHPEQIPMLAKYREEQSFCPMCHQKFGTGETRTLETV